MSTTPTLSSLLRRVLLGIAALAAVTGPAVAADGEKRVALIIGNAAYSATAILQNPLNDVALMERTFRAAGFTAVDTVTNVDRAGMIAALRDFEDKASGADIAVIYYSGHGMEMAGQNYLIPVDARLSTDRDVVDEAVTLDRVQVALDGVKRLRLVILDACRNNPFETTMKRSMSFRSVSRGLSRVEPGTNTLVAFAAKAGTVADDGTGANSPYATALATRLLEPGVDVQLAFRKVRDDVLEATGQRQEPFVYGSLGGTQLSLTKTMPPLAGEADQDAIWDAVKAAGDAQLVRDFILKYPRSLHREAAIALLTDLQKPRGILVPAHQDVDPPKGSEPLPAVKPTALVTPAELPAPHPEPDKTVPAQEPAAEAAVPDDGTPALARPAAKAKKPLRPATRQRASATGGAPARSKSGFFFSCKLPRKNSVNSSYYGDGAGVIRCAN